MSVRAKKNSKPLTEKTQGDTGEVCYLFFFDYFICGNAGNSWLIVFFLKTRLQYPHSAVLNSPPTVALRDWARQFAEDSSFSSGRTREWASRYWSLSG
jgi:hypothetical protein